MVRFSAARIVVIAGCAYFSIGCAGMIAGSPGWFENKRADVEPTASTDLACTGKPIEFAAVTMDDYREVEARGCGKKVRYKFTKISFVEKWVKSSEVSAI
jgi:hypothetical protein